MNIVTREVKYRIERIIGFSKLPFKFRENVRFWKLNNVLELEGPDGNLSIAFKEGSKTEPYAGTPSYYVDLIQVVNRDTTGKILHIDEHANLDCYHNFRKDCYTKLTSFLLDTLTLHVDAFIDHY